MQSRGMSLVEVVVVMTIMAVLVAVGTLQFREYSRRYRSEAQTRLLFGELMKARNDAFCRRRPVRVKLYPERFEVYSSQHDSGTTPLQIHRLSFPLTWKGIDPDTGFDLDFGFDGLALQNLTVCLADAAGTGGVDSIKIFKTRVSIGKKDKGNDCDPDNITVK